MNFSGKYGSRPEQLDAERAAQAGEARADGEGRGEHRADGDAQPARHAGIVDGGAQAAAEAGAHQAELQAERQRAADHDQERAVDADIDAEHLAPALQPRRQLDVALARAHELVGRRHGDEHQADREQHLLEMARPYMWT